MNEPSFPQIVEPHAFDGGLGGRRVDHAERFSDLIAPALSLDVHRRAAERRASRVRRSYQHLSFAMAMTDAASVLFALALASFTHQRVLTSPLHVWIVTLIAPAMVIAIFVAFRLYSVARITAAEEFRRLLLAVTMLITSAVTFSYWTKAEFSRLWIALSWVLAMLFVMTSRYVWRKSIRRAREHGWLSLRTLIVGANDEAGRVATEMRQRDLGFVPLGYVCADAWGRPTTDIPMLGHIDDLQELIVDNDAECVFVASSSIRPEHMSQVSKASRREGVEVRITANVQEVLSTRVAAQPLGGLMAFALRPVRLSGLQAIAKRSFDLALTAAALLALSPILAVIALAVKLTSHGPILFAQERVGYHGRPFRILKYRTMVSDAEQRLEDLLHRNEATGPLFKMKDDPRVTPVGRFLRKWSLDELPQLWNVLRGDMSLVGPRPPLPREVAQYEDWQLARLEVRPGLTGLWQVSGRSELPFDDYVRLDLFYIENWSLAYDLFILAKTVPTMVTGRGAH